MNFESWRIQFQSDEQAARAAFDQLSKTEEKANLVTQESKSYIAAIETMNTQNPVHVEWDDEPVHAQRDEWVEYIKERTEQLKAVLASKTEQVR